MKGFIAGVGCASWGFALAAGASRISPCPLEVVIAALVLAAISFIGAAMVSE